MDHTGNEKYVMPGFKVFRSLIPIPKPDTAVSTGASYQAARPMKTALVTADRTTQGSRKSAEVTSFRK